MRSIPILSVLAALVIGAGCSSTPQHYVEAGNKFYALHRYEDASIQYRKALQKDPNFGEAVYRLGLIALENNKFNDAYPLLLRAVDLLPANEEVKTKLAEVSLALYARSGHPKSYYDMAMRMSDKLLEKNSDSFEGLRIRGLVRLLDGRPKDAAENLEKANRIKPLQHDVVLSWAQALFQDGQSQEAERLALQLIKKEPTFEPIYDVLYGEYESLNRPADAEKILTLKIENNPNNGANLIQLARFYARAQRTAEMTATVDRLLSDKRFGDARLQAGDFYASLGNWPEAARQFQDGARASSNVKTRVVYQKKTVDALLAQGKRVEAQEVVEAILKDDPKDPDARRVRANLLAERGGPGDLDAAAKQLDELIKENANDPALRFSRGRVFLAQGATDRAIAEFQQAIRARRDYLPAIRALAVTNLRQQRPGEALQYVQQLVVYQPDNASARLLGVVTLTALGRYNDAHYELNRLLKSYPDDYNIQLQRGMLALAEKKYKDAEAVLQKLDEAAPGDLRPAAALADLYAAQEQFDRAQRLIEEDLKRAPDSAPLKELLAMIAARAGKYDLAIGVYQDLLGKERGMNSTGLLLRVAAVYQKKGDDQSAIAALNKARQLAPREPASAIMMGISQGRIGRIDEAKAAYREALQAQPDNATALNNLAYLLVESGGSLDEAQNLVERALKKVPGQPNYTDTLGFIYLKKRMNDSAVRTFDNLVRQQPANPTFRFHLGWALLESGDKNRAKRELENALANRPSGDQAAKIKALMGKAS